MLKKKEDIFLVENDKGCLVSEYQLDLENIGVVKVELDGRYPQEGKVMNQESDLIYFVLSGEGLVNGEIKIGPQDIYVFKKGVPYFVEGKNLVFVGITQPAWKLEQHKKID